MADYTDRVERDALLDGASALRYRSERLRNYASNREEFAMAESFLANAAILTEMADVYEVDDDDAA